LHQIPQPAITSSRYPDEVSDANQDSAAATTT